MYKQIKVYHGDQQFQTILWRGDAKDKVRCYAYTRVTFGMACSPYLATRCMKDIADNTWLSLAAEAINNHLYMDDLEISNNDAQKLCKIQKEVEVALAERGFKMTKWATNEIELSKNWADSRKETKVLGMKWDPKKDELSFAWSPNAVTQNVTMRQFLSEVQQLYDPMGILSPVTVRARMLLQQMFIEKLKWDQRLPERMQAEYKSYIQDLKEVNQVYFPRWVGLKEKFNLHGFADASGKAYAAVVYYETKDGMQILMSRSRVAPIKPISIPRMELKAAALLAELLHFLKSTVEVNRVNAYSNSQAV